MQRHRPRRRTAAGPAGRLLRRSAAARKARYSTVKIWVGAICAALVVLPVLFARVLPLPDPLRGVLNAPHLPPFSARPPARDRPQRARPALAHPLRRPDLPAHRLPRDRPVRASSASSPVPRPATSAAGSTRSISRAPRGPDVPAAAAHAAARRRALRPLGAGHHARHRPRPVAGTGPPDPRPRPRRAREALRRRGPGPRAAQAEPIIVRHIIPNILSQTLVVVFLLLAQAVLLESALSFLGAGVQRPYPTWGGIISDGRELFVTGEWWLVTIPGLAIALLVVGVNLLGDGLRDRVRRAKAVTRLMSVLDVRDLTVDLMTPARRHPRRRRRQLPHRPRRDRDDHRRVRLGQVDDRDGAAPPAARRPRGHHRDRPRSTARTSCRTRKHVSDAARSIGRPHPAGPDDGAQPDRDVGKQMVEAIRLAHSELSKEGRRRPAPWTCSSRCTSACPSAG